MYPIQIPGHWARIIEKSSSNPLCHVLMESMKTQIAIKFPQCSSSDTSPYKTYQTVYNGSRQLLLCQSCNICFSETSNTPMEYLKSPVSKIALPLKLRSEGMGLRATGRVLQSHKNTISRWEKLFVEQKDTLMLYAFCHEFIFLTFEKDELYAIVNQRTDHADSRRWTAVIMDRTSRFIVDQICGRKDASLFKSVMENVCKFVGCTNDLSFLSDGERRYGNIL